MKNYKKHKQKKPISGVRMRAPKGFYFEVEQSYNRNYTICLYQKLTGYDRLIGEVDLNRVYKTNVYKTHSDLNPQFWGRGLGARMYARAIKFGLDEGFCVRSSGNSSDLAKRVWKGKTLRKYFRITKKNIGACGATWYAHPKSK